ncbi:MAG: acetate--CoA ligase family protein [Hyphomicrobiaceae bacterium]|nr:acetate--CoA ligase family protein [Hyphomicrobiaceae bacterium]
MPDFNALLNPRTIAIIGASPDTARLRGMLPEIMVSQPYPGKIYPVSRSHDEVQGLKTCASIGEVPEPVDLAILMIPSRYVPDELERCGKAGARAALIVTSGFAEQSEDEGRGDQVRLADIAKAFDMAVLGPNSEGFASSTLSVAATFSPALHAPEKPMLPPWHDEGRVAVVAQSGAVGFSFFDLGRKKELPFRYVVTTGNEASTEVFDLVDFMLDEGKTDVFILFLEDIKSPDTFRSAARKALELGKPLIAAKLGRSEAAVRATASHTGALAGSYDIYAAMFHHYGITVCDDAEQMVDTANTFLANMGRLPKGRRVAITTGSGGAGAWMADACVALGLEVPELDPKAREEIDAYLPAYGTSQNPVDGTAQAIREIGYIRLAQLAAQANNVDSVVMVASTARKDSFERERPHFFEVAQTLKKPIACWSYTIPHKISQEIFAETGIPLHTNMRNCAHSIAALADYAEARARALSAPGKPHEPHTNMETVSELMAAEGRILCEFTARTVLAQYGIGNAPSALAKSPDEAVALATAAAGPVALKVQSPDVPHKSDAGGVALNVEGDEAVRRAFETILSSVRSNHPDADIPGVLVEPMTPDGIEFILGIKRDPTFGPMLAAGLGGIYVETFKDVVFAPAPLSETASQALLQRLRGWAVLTGTRGAPPADVDALVAVMVALSGFAADFADQIFEVDLNPVIVHPEGEGVSIVDALIVQAS